MKDIEILKIHWKKLSKKWEKLRAWEARLRWWVLKDDETDEDERTTTKTRSCPSGGAGCVRFTPPQGCLLGQIKWGNAKTPRSQPKGPWHEVSLVLWAKMAPRGSPLRARSKQRNKETEKLRNRETEKLREIEGLRRNCRNWEKLKEIERNWKKLRRNWEEIERNWEEIERKWEKLREIGSWKLTMNKKQNVRDLTRPGPEARRICG